MLLKNFIKAMCYGLTSDRDVVTTLGSTYNSSPASNSVPFNAYKNSGSNGTSMSYLGIALGTDDTPPSLYRYPD